MMVRVCRLLLCGLLVCAGTGQAAVTGWSASNHLRRQAQVVSAYPYLVSAWAFVATSHATRYVAMAGTDGQNNNQRGGIIITATGQVSAFGRTTANFAAATTTTASLDTWFHGMAHFRTTTGASARRALLNGGGAAQDSTTADPAAANSFYVGVRPDTVSAFQSTGGLAEISVWDTTGFTLQQGDDLGILLATPVSGSAPNPLAVNAQSGQPWAGRLVAYWRLTDHTDLNDLSGNGHTLSTVGTLTTFGSHPPVDAVPAEGDAAQVIIID